MRFLAGQRDLKPVQPLSVCHDADIDSSVLENRPLLDVKLEESGKLAGANLLVTDPADPFELAANRLASSVRAAIGPVQRVHASENTGGHHGRRKTCAFLICPVHNLNRMTGLDTGLIQRPDDFQPGKNAENAIILATCRLGVEMASPP